MEVWTIWLLVAIGIFILEIFSSGFALACLSVGALTASVTSLITDSLNWQIGAFVFFTAIVFIFIRPIILRVMIEKSSQTPTNLDALIGRTAVVSQKFEVGEGRVSVDGDDWKAEAEDVEEVFDVGDKVKIIAINSIIVTIKKH